VRKTPDKDEIKRITRQLLTLLGEDPNREGLQGTPDRVAEMLEELTSGYWEDPKSILSREFNEVTGMVVAKDIDFFSLCEHHLLPFFGRVSIGYIPNKKVVGLSKIVRLVNVFSRRLQLQERLTKQIADAINLHLKPLGVIVVIQARHLCMEMRGVKNSADIVTSEIRGQFERYETRSEFLSMLNRPDLTL
jgi:GTP cyclohydrolase I